jgi:hypothetical protein
MLYFLDFFGAFGRPPYLPPPGVGGWFGGGRRDYPRLLILE